MNACTKRRTQVVTPCAVDVDDSICQEKRLILLYPRVNFNGQVGMERQHSGVENQKEVLMQALLRVMLQTSCENSINRAHKAD